MENIMDGDQQQGLSEPVSPSGQYLSSSTLSLSIIAVLESEVPIRDSQLIPLLKDVLLPINPRFSSIMVMDKNGEKRWKSVEVNIKDHLHIPTFPAGKSSEFYDELLDDYLSKLAIEQLPQSRPLWEIHGIKYPTSHAAGNIIFKLHHSLGDGFSLMGALLSCLQRADNPSLPLTFPSAQLNTKNGASHGGNGGWGIVSKLFSLVCNTVSDFGSSILRSTGLVEDDKSPIRSGHSGVEFLPVSIVTLSFSLDRIKQIKAMLGVTINDVITGTIFLGTRLYMQSTRQGTGKERTTSLVLLNTRMFRGYKSVEEMVKPDSESPWGNHFAFLSIPIPKLNDESGHGNPLYFVWKARETIFRKKTSLAVHLTARFLQLVRKFRGPEAASKYLHGTLKNTSIGLTNLIGPMEPMALPNHPIKGLYFVVTGAPQSIMVGIISYMGKVRVAVLVEKGFIDPQKLKSNIESAFDMIFRAACGTPPEN